MTDFGQIVTERIRKALTLALSPVSIEILDNSHQHTGHSGARPGGGTHYSVKVVSNVFQEMNSLNRHRLVYDALSEEFSGRLHALSISAKTPEEI